VAAEGGIPRVDARFRDAARFASALVVVTGVVVCAGWFLGVPILQQLRPRLASMKLNTALVLGFLGLALGSSIQRPSGTPVTRALALAAAAIAAATLVEYALDVDLGIDELLCRDPTAVSAPGRMAPATAVCVLLLGVSIAWLDRWWAEWLGLVTAGFAHLALLGYVYGVTAPSGIWPFASVALHTAVSLYLLALGIVLARPGRGLMCVVTSDSPGGVLARRLLPMAMVVPAVLALLRQWGEAAGLYGTGAGRAMLVASSSAFLAALVWWTAAAIVRSDGQRRANEAVRQREAHLAITLDSIGDGMIATDERGHIVRMNATAERLTGWSAAAALGRSFPEVFRIADEDTGAAVESLVDQVLRDGVVTGLPPHSLLVARDGTTCAIAVRSAPIRGARGAPRGVVLVFQDQREARAAERQLRDREARKAAILESALDAIVSVDDHGTILEFNAAAEVMFGRPRGETVGAQLADVLVAATLRNTHRSQLARHLATDERSETPKRVEIMALRPDGTEFPIEISITQVHHAGPPMFTRFIRDVSEAQQARAELVRSYDRLHTLASVSDTFATVATSYQALLDKIARTIADLVGDGCLVTLLSEDGERLGNAANAHRDPALELAYRAYLSGVAVATTTNSSIAATVVRTGEPRRADILPSAMVDQTEEALKPIVALLNVHSFAVVPIRARQAVTGTLSLLRSRPGQSYTDDDLTLLQDLADRAGLAIENARGYEQLEQRVHARTKELEAANRELEAFSYSVAHDLRAPLRSIAGFSRAVLEDHAEHLGPGGVQHMNRIEASARRMRELIDALLDLSRVNRAELHRQPIQLSAMARAVIAQLQATQPSRDVEIVIEDGLVAEADPRLLTIVLTNLLSNAWKFTGKRARTRIELATCAGERPTTFVIRDNGAGFHGAHAGKLFGVFERLHTAAEFEGTGIGLAIVQRIIQRHGGRVWAEGNVDEGAAFFFTLETGHDREAHC